MTDEQLIDVMKLCIKAGAPILKSDAEGLLSIIERQAGEIKLLRTTLKDITKHAESRQCVVEEELLKECEALHSEKRSRKLHRALSGEMGSLGTILHHTKEGGFFD